MESIPNPSFFNPRVRIGAKVRSGANPIPACLNPGGSNPERLSDMRGAFLVGGSVRDILLDRSPDDYDIAVLTDPEVFAARMARSLGKRPIPIGKPGKRVYRIVTEAHTFDIAPVNGPTIESDLKRRDFTINALALSLFSGELIDCTGGLADLKRKRIRMVSEAAFTDDPIRLIRAFRMGAMLDFDIDIHTAEAIERHAGGIEETAGERIWAELSKILEAPSACEHFIRMKETGLLFRLFPELQTLKGCTQNRHHAFDVLDHTFRAFAHLESILHPGAAIPGDLFSQVRPMLGESRSRLLKAAVLFHDIGKPAARSRGEGGNIHFYGHEAIGAERFDNIAERLKLSNVEARFIHRMIRHHLRPLHLFNAFRSGKSIRRAITRFFIRLEADAPLMLLHALADHWGKREGGKKEGGGETGFPDPYPDFIIDLIQDYFSRFQPRKETRPLITGHDIRREFGISPSPLYRRILDRVEEERLSDESFGRPEALRLAEAMIRKEADRR